MPQPDVVLQPRPAQIEVAVPQADVFRHRAVFRDLKRRRLRLVEQHDLARQDLDLAGRQLRVHGVFRAALHHALDADDEFRAQALGDRHQRVVLADDDLRHTRAIANVDEGDAAQVADAVHPSQHHRLRPDILGAEGAARVRSSESA